MEQEMIDAFEKWHSQPEVKREWEGTHAEHLRRVWVAALDARDKLERLKDFIMVVHGSKSRIIVSVPEKSKEELKREVENACGKHEGDQVTDKIKALTVVLEEDFYDDGVEHLVNAIKMMKGVLTVETHVSDLNLMIAEERVRNDWRNKLLKLLWPERG